MRGALEVHQVLLAAGVPHEVVRLDSRVRTADDLPRALGLPTGCLAVRCYVVTTVVPTGATGGVTTGSTTGSTTGEGAGGGAGRDDARDAVVAVLVPAGRTPAPGPLLDALGARSLRPALPGEVNAATDCAAGLVCPVGLPPEVALLADAAVGATDVVYTPIGEGGLALGIRTRDLLVVARARVATLTTSAAGPQDALLDPADVVLHLDDAPAQRRPV